MFHRSKGIRISQTLDRGRIKNGPTTGPWTRRGGSSAELITCHTHPEPGDRPERTRPLNPRHRRLMQHPPSLRASGRSHKHDGEACECGGGALGGCPSPCASPIHPHQWSPGLLSTVFAASPSQNSIRLLHRATAYRPRAQGSHGYLGSREGCDEDRRPFLASRCFSSLLIVVPARGSCASVCAHFVIRARVAAVPCPWTSSGLGGHGRGEQEGHGR